jgi:DNA invertase Pin-like site-specific DNA recombinase
MLSRGALAAPSDPWNFDASDVPPPALQRLLADVKTRKVDVIVVYKVDRLTRSLADFASS